MSEPQISQTIFHFLEKNVGKKAIVILDRDFGYEGRIEAISHTPPGIWMADADAVVLRTTIANPIPKVVSKEKKSELFIHLNYVQRVEIISHK